MSLLKLSSVFLIKLLQFFVIEFWGNYCSSMIDVLSDSRLLSTSFRTQSLLVFISRSLLICWNSLSMQTLFSGFIFLSSRLALLLLLLLLLSVWCPNHRLDKFRIFLKKIPGTTTKDPKFINSSLLLSVFLLFAPKFS